MPTMNAERSRRRMPHRDRGERDRSDLPDPRRLQAQAGDCQTLDALRGPEGGDDGLETFVLRLKDGDILAQLVDVVADVCDVGHCRDVCDEREHGERCDCEDRNDGRTSPPTPGRLLPS